MMAGRKPFLWEGGGHEAVLCLHGFTGAPGIFRKLGHELQKEGLTVYAPCLPGHGTAPGDLLEVTGEQLVDASKEAYTQLKNSFDRVHIIGLSLGGALATLLAAGYSEDGSLGSVTLLSPGYAFNKVLAARLGLTQWSDTTDSSRMIPLPQRKPQNDEMDECIFGYDAVPLGTFGRLQAFNVYAGTTRPNVKAPVLLLYTEADGVVDAEACAESIKLIPSIKETHAFKESEHNLLLGCDREETMLRCKAFIQRHRI